MSAARDGSSLRPPPLSLEHFQVELGVGQPVPQHLSTVRLCRVEWEVRRDEDAGSSVGVPNPLDLGRTLGDGAREAVDANHDDTPYWVCGVEYATHQALPLGALEVAACVVRVVEPFDHLEAQLSGARRDAFLLVLARDEASPLRPPTRDTRV